MKKLTIPFKFYLWFFAGGALILLAGSFFDVKQTMSTILYGIGTGVVSSTLVALASDWKTNDSKSKSDAEVLIKYISMDFLLLFDTFDGYIKSICSISPEASTTAETKQALDSICNNESFWEKHGTSIEGKIMELQKCIMSIKKGILYTGNAYDNTLLEPLENAADANLDFLTYYKTRNQTESFPKNRLLASYQNNSRVYEFLKEIKKSNGINIDLP